MSGRNSRQTHSVREWRPALPTGRWQLGAEELSPGSEHQDPGGGCLQGLCHMGHRGSSCGGTWYHLASLFLGSEAREAQQGVESRPAPACGRA